MSVDCKSVHFGRPSFSLDALRRTYTDAGVIGGVGRLATALLLVDMGEYGDICSEFRIRITN